MVIEIGGYNFYVVVIFVEKKKEGLEQGQSLSEEVVIKGNLNVIMELCLRRGFLIPTAEIYGGLAGAFDWGPLGCSLKNKVVEFWRKLFVRGEDNVFEIDGATVLPEAVLKASGHADHFTDPVISCKKCDESYRADHLVEEKLGMKGEGLSPSELNDLIVEGGLRCDKCEGELEEVRVFNLMFKTNIGSIEGNVAYLRPETAQSIFIDFKRIARSMRAKLPFGVAQIGHSYRNEISPRQAIIRLREFSQMEVEMFVHEDELNDFPGFERVANVPIRILTREQQQEEGGKDEGEVEPVEATAEEAVSRGIVPNKTLAYFLAKEVLFFEGLGIPPKAFKFRHMLPSETPHYSSGNFDLEVLFSFGWTEVVGNAHRTDYDLSNHSKFSGEKLKIQHGKDMVTPHVVEPSFGVERIVYAILEHSYRKDGERKWTWLKLAEQMPEKAYKIYRYLKDEDFDAIYDDSGQIGRRYARADEIGIPYCATVDHETFEDDTVTIRDRDTTRQVRVPVKELQEVLKKLLNDEIKFEESGNPISTK